MKKEKKAFQSEGLGFGAGDNKETKKKKNVGRIIELRQTQNQPKDKVLAQRLKTV